MVDFFETAVGLHVNGTATIVENDAVEAFAPLFDRLPFATAMRRGPPRSRRRRSAGSWSRSTRPTSTAPSTSRCCSTPEGEDAEAGRRAGDVFKAKNGERAWLQPRRARSEAEPEPVIGEVRFASRRAGAARTPRRAAELRLRRSASSG